ncbi:MAG: CRISPR-associated protein Cas4 [Pseudomonadota bacterium]|nr:CRISPR-associated protein Cas4 [Pseudomonadota bacterium]
MKDTETTPMLTPSEVLEHVWCPRFTWFMQVQQIAQHEENRFKVQKGREVHQRREIENPRYLRRKLGVVDKQIAVYLAAPQLRLRGIVDEVLWLQDESLAPLDYKYTLGNAWDKVFKTHEMQIVMYAMLVEAVYQQPVNKGFVAYIREHTQILEVELNEKNRQQISEYIDEIFGIINTGRLPKRTPQRVRCVDCCYKTICV